METIELLKIAENDYRIVDITELLKKFKNVKLVNDTGCTFSLVANSLNSSKLKRYLKKATKFEKHYPRKNTRTF